MPVRDIVVKVTGDDSGLTKTMADAGQSVTGFSKITATVRTGKIGMAVNLTKKLASATVETAKAGSNAAAAEAEFTRAMEATGVATGDWIKKTDEAIAAGQKKAFTDDEQRAALVELTTATGSVDTATQLLTGAQDLARMKGIDLSTATDALAKAYTGNTMSLHRMIPGLDKGAKSTDVIKEATDLAAGAADEYAKSSQATGEKATIAFGEIQEEVGKKLLPAMQDLWTSIKPVLAGFLKLAMMVLPPLLRALGKLFDIGGKVFEVIGKIAEAVGRLITKIRDLLAPLGEMVDKLKNIDLNPFNKAKELLGRSSTVTYAPGVSTTASEPGRGGLRGVTVNIYGDPSVIEARVMKALRDYARRNGAGAVFAPGRA